jgi:hypothetical protein
MEAGNNRRHGSWRLKEREPEARGHKAWHERKNSEALGIENKKEKERN